MSDDGKPTREVWANPPRDEDFSVGPRPAPRMVSTELACARALLDALEVLIDAESEEGIAFDLVVQVADQLARLSGTMKRWESERHQPPLRKALPSPSPDAGEPRARPRVTVLGLSASKKARFQW